MPLPVDHYTYVPPPANEFVMAASHTVWIGDPSGDHCLAEVRIFADDGWVVTDNGSLFTDEGDMGMAALVQGF